MDIISRKRKRDDIDSSYKRFKVTIPFNTHQTMPHNLGISNLQHVKMNQIYTELTTKNKELLKINKELEKYNQSLQNNNQHLQNEISILKNKLYEIEELYESLQKQVLDIHRSYFMETTPFEPNCSYLN